MAQVDGKQRKHAKAVNTLVGLGMQEASLRCDASLGPSISLAGCLFKSWLKYVCKERLTS
jgi:hypothetical protein